MLTNYEQHLYEIMDKTQNELKQVVDENNSLKTRNQELQEERDKFRDYWFEYSAKASKLEKQIQDLLEKGEEQGVAAPSSSNDLTDTLKEVI
ncbi:hypothetical protein DYP60_05415 [Sphaerochaeta halotolerans]|uniref:Cell division protein ZapB n=1 Tax=Sphaerochaeta halotolerans TaxID=2293840 RepID=A0A372MGZ8_9SPIR|nr:hypothetical protein [Sphaerochaeta halotolerans]RFU95067.1 hypothetical protein DYP60_05415 [Sphaerochaeta halotolerans]